MSERIEGWKRQREPFWRAHHEAWKRSDLNQREYCAAFGLPLRAFGNWRAQFKAEPPPLAPKLLYRRGGLSHTLNPTLSHTLSHGAYPTSLLAVAPAREGHRRRFSTAERQQIIAEAEQPGASVSDVVRRFGIDRRLLCRWRQEAAAVAFVAVEICDAQTPTEERAP